MTDRRHHVLASLWPLVPVCVGAIPDSDDLEKAT